MEEGIYCFGVKRKEDIAVVYDPIAIENSLIFEISDYQVNDFFKDVGVESFYDRGVLFVKAKNEEGLNKFLRYFNLIVPKFIVNIFSIYLIGKKILIKMNKTYLDWKDALEDVKKILQSLRINLDINKLISKTKPKFFDDETEEDYSRISYADSETTLPRREVEIFTPLL